MLKDLEQLINIPSVSQKGSGDYPYGDACNSALETALAICEGHGLNTKNCGNYCGYAEIGDGEEIFGILVHLDVVPAGSGWSYNPFELTANDGKLYGRGVCDDKGPAVAVIYAMKELISTPLNKRVRLIFGISEETGDGGDIAYYKEHEELPTSGFTPDADFPVVYLEKGLAEIKLLYPLEGSGIKSIQGGVASNMVADTCEITLSGEGSAHSFTGKSAHGSMPWLGENAISNGIVSLADRYTSEESRFLHDYKSLIGTSFKGESLGCDFKDQDSGETTVNVGLIEILEDNICITLDIRCAVCCTKELLIESVTKKAAKLGFEVELTDWLDSVHMPLDSELVVNLVKAYEKITGDKSEPLTMGGATYAREMENIVAFGPSFPGRELTEHQPDEYMYEEDFYKLKEIYKEAIMLNCTK